MSIDLRFELPDGTVSRQSADCVTEEIDDRTFVTRYRPLQFLSSTSVQAATSVNLSRRSRVSSCTSKIQFLVIVARAAVRGLRIDGNRCDDGLMDDSFTVTEHRDFI